MSETNQEPLSGITVLEMTLALQGPGAGLYLSDMGADVIKVEPPEGDAARYIRGVKNQSPAEAQSPTFICVNRGKKSVCVDIRTETGREVIDRLLEKADVFLSNYRQPFLKSIGLDYESLSEKHPQLVYAHVSGYGPEGPDKDKSMLDGAAQARGGLVGISGQPGETPTLPGAAIIDMTGAMQLALGVMTGLFARARHGKGQKVSTSGLGATLWLQQWELQQCMISGVPLAASGSHIPSIEGPYGVYDTKDGGAFMFANAQDEESWDALCIFAELFELIGDADWNTAGKRLGASGVGPSPDKVRALLRRGFASRTTAEWIDFMYSQPALIMERVRGHADVITDEQNIANEYIVPMDIPHIGESKVVGNTVRLSKTPGLVKGSAPDLGANTSEVLAQLGFEQDVIEAVLADNAVKLQEMIDALAEV